MMLRSILLVAMGGALGSAGRFVLSRLLQEGAQTAFPLATFVVNMVGCFVIGLVYGLSARGNAMGDGTKLLLTTGFCGGFTTFSTFCHEGVALMRGGSHGLTLVYAMGSVAVGFVAVWMGLWVASKASMD